MSEDGTGAEGTTKDEAFRDLVVSARVYYRNDKRIDWPEWQHLTNEAAELGLTDEDALRAAREAIGASAWSPPLPPPMGARWSESTDGTSSLPRPGAGPNSLEAISLDSSMDSGVTVSRLKRGVVINDTYRLEEEIGAGGMGVVWRASHTKLGTQVAIKFLKHALGEDSAARFLREARTTARLESPHLARVFDCAQLETGELFIVMEYFEGMGLDRHLEREGPLPVAEAVDYILQACVGLAVAHKREIVHRDIKPANLFLAETEDGGRQIKIVDFGLSRLAQPEDGEGLTRDQILLGTPEYAPPEQFGSAMNAREPADIWSLGATLYCLLTGKPPFPRDPALSGLFQMSDLLKRVTEGAPKPITGGAAKVPGDLEKVILKCLEKRPERRYPSVADLAQDLAHFASTHAQARADEAVQILSSSRATRTSSPEGRGSYSGTARVSVLGEGASREAAQPPRKSAAASPKALWTGVAVIVVVLIAIAVLLKSL